MYFRLAVLAALALVILGGCTSPEDLTTPEDVGLIRALHAIEEAEAIGLAIDGRALTSATYRRVSGLLRPGVGEHRLVFDTKFADGTTGTLLTRDLTSELDVEQTLVLLGTLADPVTVLWEQPARRWLAESQASTEPLTVLEISFGHAAPALGEVDVYLGEPGFDPAAQLPVGTMSYSGLIAKSEIPADVYQIVFTAAGDPAQVLLESTSLTLPAATSLLYVAIDSGATGTGDFTVLRLGAVGTPVELVNRVLPAELRVVHAAPDLGAIDVYFDNDFSAPVFADLDFESVSGYEEVPTGEDRADLNGDGAPGVAGVDDDGDGEIDEGSVDDDDEDGLVDEDRINGLDDDGDGLVDEDPGADIVAAATPAGNPSVVLLDATLTLLSGNEYTLLALGSADAEVLTVVTDNNRRVVTLAKIRFFSGASELGLVDTYLLQPDDDIETTFPFLFSQTVGAVTGYFNVLAGDYDLVVTESGSKTPVAGPQRVSLEAGGLYGVVVVDSTQMTGAARFLLFEDFLTGTDGR